MPQNNQEITQSQEFKDCGINNLDFPQISILYLYPAIVEPIRVFSQR